MRLGPAITTAAVLSFLLTGVTACASSQSEPQATIVVPSAATTAPEYRGDGSVPSQRYVVRMSDGQRDWEVEFPEVAHGYEVRIPLRDDQRDVRRAHDALTRADRELIDHLRQTDPNFEREGVFIDDEHALDRQARRERGEERSDQDADPRRRSESDPAPTRPSYFRGIAEVQQLFNAGHYETAMVHLADLEEAYPSDVRIKSMKGTLWLRLGNEDLARKNWEQVLQIEPDNQPVQEALRRLDGVPQDDDEFADDESLE